MSAPAADFYFDFLDPLSYLVGLELTRLDPTDTVEIRWVGVELRPPPSPLIAQDDQALAHRWRDARTVAQRLGITFDPPALAPWTRKAHELVLHAAESELDALVRTRVFEAYLLDGLDIGRVDVLVAIARDAGLDTTESKAVLDVDRFEAAAADAMATAVDAGITDVPTLLREGRQLRGFHNHAALGTFLRR